MRLTREQLEAARARLSPEEFDELLDLYEAELSAEDRRRFYGMFPDTGPLRRELYARHMEFFEAGKWASERLFMAANRVGKTEGAGGYEMTAHLTGRYPSWWPGYRFSGPVNAWAAGDTLETTTEIQQKKLLGPRTLLGTGLIPAECIGRVRWRAGPIADAASSVLVRHITGGWSRLMFKSYDQRRKAFQGTEQEVIWLDEECPYDIYLECLTRTMATGKFRGGLLMATYTPLMGLTETTLHFLPDGRIPGVSDEEAA